MMTRPGSPKSILRQIPVIVIFLICCVLTLQAEVVSLKIVSREIVPGSELLVKTGRYEKIKGIVYFEIDAVHPLNTVIADLALAPRNSRGMVEFHADFELHTPVDPARGNRRLLYFVNNRGNKMGEGFFNCEADGNWLYREGYSYLWCGWNADVVDDAHKLNITVPVAIKNGEIVTGRVYSEIISFADDLVYSMPIVWGGSKAYVPASLDNTGAILTMRQYRNEDPVSLPQDSWAFARFENGTVIPDSGNIYIRDGFKPGWLYDLVYTAKNPRICGVGMAAIRDLVAYVRYADDGQTAGGNPLAGMIDHAYAWGHSQSARLLNHFIHENFNQDERERIVFDGVMANCPGAGRGMFNSRFAQLTRHGSHHEDNLFPIDVFPFAGTETADPITGEKGEAYALARQAGTMPKVMIINSSTDYWTRAASLLHTDVTGEEDLPIDPDVRLYLISGYAHTESRTGIISRALLAALDEWVTCGVEPPPSCIPRIADGTLVSVSAFRQSFPAIPGILVPESCYQPLRLDMGPRWQEEKVADNAPPIPGQPFVCLVPQVDEDGNELAGIRLPEVDLPLATFTGWSMRNPQFSHTLQRNAGRVYPLPITAHEREEDHDPRDSVLERYPTRAGFFFKTIQNLVYLNAQRVLLDEDMARMLLAFAELPYWFDSQGPASVYIRHVVAVPDTLHPGDTVVFRAEFSGARRDVLLASVRFREGAGMRFDLNDNGKDGDESAGDHVWSYALNLPTDVPPGNFHFDFQALGRGFDPVPDLISKSRTVPVTITIQ